LHSSPRISGSVSVFDLKYGKRCYPNSISCKFDLFPFLESRAAGVAALRACPQKISILDTQFERLTVFNTQFGRSYKFDIEPMNFFNPRDCPLFSIFSFFFSYFLLLISQFEGQIFPWTLSL